MGKIKGALGAGARRRRTKGKYPGLNLGRPFREVKKKHRRTMRGLFLKPGRGGQ